MKNNVEQTPDAEYVQYNSGTNTSIGIAFYFFWNGKPKG